MNKFLLSIGLVIILLSLVINAFGQCAGSYILKHQSQVNDFKDENCVELVGSLHIGDFSDYSLINDLSPLTGLKRITGNLTISRNNILENLVGLDSLEFIGGDLTIEHNNGLVSLEGLGQLDSIGKSLGIVRCEKLLSVFGLGNLKSIGGTFSISSNTKLLSLEDLNSLSNIGEDLFISHSNIVNFFGLEKIDTIQNFSLINSFDAPNFEGLDNLASINGNFEILNSGLMNFGGLNSLVSIEGEIYVGYSHELINFYGLESLENIRSKIKIEYCSELINLYGFESLENIENDLGISYCGNLINLKGLENLESIEGSLGILDCDNLINLDGLENLESIGTGLFLNGNYNLVSLSSLQNLENVGGSIWIVYNQSLESCCVVLNFLSQESYPSIYNNSLSCNGLGNIIDWCKEAEIKGLTFYDENANGIFDSEEIHLNQNILLYPDSIYGYNDDFGVNHFCLFEMGNYYLSYNNENPLWTIDSSYNNVEVIYQDSTINDTMIYFPLTPISDVIAHEIDLSSSLSRCLRETNYWLTYTNAGTVSTSGVVELIPDDLTAFVSSDPPVDSIANDGKLFWFYDDLYPTYSEQIRLVYKMPDPNYLGDTIQFEANISNNDGSVIDKAFALSELICTNESNYKLNTPSSKEGNYTLFSDTLEYTIHFQNTSDVAIVPNVMVLDKLSPSLDLETFELIASSHSVETELDRNTNWATFRFNDINLPNNYIDELASRGFVKFRILPKRGLEESVEIRNKAIIYFDGSSSFTENTNTVINRMVWEIPTKSLEVPVKLDFGELFSYGQSSEVLTIANLTDFPLNINEFYFHNNNNFYVDEDLGLVTIDAHSSQNIPIYFTPWEPKNYQSELILKSDVGDIVIELCGELLPSPPLPSFYPNEINFGEMSLIDSSASRSFIIYNEGELPLEITAFEFENPVFNSGDIQDLTIEEEIEVEINFQPTEAGDYQSELVLKTNVKDYVFLLTGTALPSPPILSTNSTELDFGEISISDSTFSEQILTISNLGDLPLEINAFEFGNAVFDAGELQNLTIEGGKSEEIAIYFKPTTVGEYQSELVLVSNAGNLTINLSGKATMTTGLSTFNQTKVEIYPNPSEGRFTLKSEGEIIENLSIQNSLGEPILSQKVNNDLFEVDLTLESKGLYFIIIETDKGIFVDKVIVY